MKKIVFPIAAVALMLCSCGDVYKTYETYEIVKQGVDMSTYTIKAPRNNWHESMHGEGNPGYYVYQQFEFPEITPQVFKNGSVLVYLIEENPEYTSKHILPYVYSRDLTDDYGKHFQIMQNIRFEVEPGLLTVAVEWQDYYSCPLDEDFTFSVCILSQGKQ